MTISFQVVNQLFFEGIPSAVASAQGTGPSGKLRTLSKLMVFFIASKINWSYTFLSVVICFVFLNCPVALVDLMSF